jgi:hypothetical protein
MALYISLITNVLHPPKHTIEMSLLYEEYNLNIAFDTGYI